MSSSAVSKSGSLGGKAFLEMGEPLPLRHSRCFKWQRVRLMETHSSHSHMRMPPAFHLRVNWL